MQTPRYSELECFVLGIIWQIGPCSAYDVRQRMRASPSTQWSASAGAIYPLVRRLEHAGLVSAEVQRTGNRTRRDYAISPAGQEALRAWVGPPISPEAVTAVHDPLRSRARFLSLLPVREQREWVRAARAALDEVEASVRTWHERHAHVDAVSRDLMTRHGEMDVRFRREWLDLVERALDLERPAGARPPPR